MSKKRSNYTRRDFMKIAGAAGLGSMVSGAANAANGATGPGRSLLVPKKAFGKTGAEVSILGMGGSHDLLSKPMLLRQAFQLGVTYWDTAEGYSRGKSEQAIGEYLGRYPGDRKKIFLVTKTRKSVPGEITAALDASLARLKTDYIDLYFIHGVSNVAKDMDLEGLKQWSNRMKAAGKIRFFGFSTHKNMEQCLMDASKLGWIDGIMTSYNYRLMNTDRMKRAVAACGKAGIGLTAMKTQASFIAHLWSTVGSNDQAAKDLIDKLGTRGFTPEQAKLKAVWENPAIASVCSEMTNLTILQANADAARGKVELSRSDKQLLHRYARDTSYGYCAGCGDRCESVIEANIPVGDIMRYVMYHYNYGEYREAARRFNRIPSDQRRLLTKIDYTEAERRCPQRMPIARLMKTAAETFG